MAQAPAVTLAALIYKEMTPMTHIYTSTVPIIISRRKHSRSEFQESKGHLHLVPRSTIVELYLRSPTRLHGVVLH
jgi:hypothetical protein